MLTYNAVQVIFNVFLCIFVSYIHFVNYYLVILQKINIFDAAVHLRNTCARQHIKLHKARYVDQHMSASVFLEQILGSLGHHNFCVSQKTKSSVLPPCISSHSGDWWLLDRIKFA